MGRIIPPKAMEGFGMSRLIGSWRMVVCALVVLVLAVLVPGQSWAAPPAGTTIVTGEIGGALYAMYLPEDWNGDLVLWAHGYHARQHPIMLPDPEVPDPVYGTMAPFRDALLGEGFAVALSSYSKNGSATEEGYRDTKRLIPLFIKEFGKPERTYVAGNSMGGLIAVRLVEKHPGLFDGAFPICGVVGGNALVFDQIMHVRALMDYFYPGALPGPFFMPDVVDPGVLWGAADWAMWNDTRTPPGWYEISQIQGLELPADPGGAYYAILIRMWAHGGTDLLERTGGKNTWGNIDTEYTGSLDDVTLNALVDRYEQHPRARVYNRLWYEPTGRLRVPMLTLHNAIDPLVPTMHEDVYAEKVASWGKSHNLVQRISGAVEFGHCAFTVEEQMEAFLDLVNWVENGVEPTP
jgi:pimeloyl-ACP methyl ester carboxylesterase